MVCCNVGTIFAYMTHMFGSTVRYKQREDPKQLRTASLPEQGPSIVAISPDGRVTVVAVNCSIYIYSSISGQIIQSLTEVHGGECV